MAGLFGDEFDIKIKATNVKDILARATNADNISDTEKVLKSKSISLEEQLEIINRSVIDVLGKQKSNIIVIRDNNTFNNYINDAIKSGRIDIDTETNNSTDAALAKLMGLCLYYPGGKQAYIPVNHTDLAKNKLPNQLTEQDCFEQLRRIKESKIDIIMHNGKFDYEVLKTTCGICIPPTWDTIIGVRLMDENIFANANTSLKSIYVNYIDKSQEKYSIESLFENVPYNYVDPEIFAYYAATDALMTDRVYEWEMNTFFKLPENKKIYDLAVNIEMPIIPVTAEMELKGVLIDQEYGQRLKEKYTNQLTTLDKEILDLVADMKPLVESWKLTDDANAKTRIYVAKKTKMSQEKIEATYTLVDDKGKRYKLGKAKVEQLEDPINLSSPTQLAILIYDVLEAPIVSKQSPRGTGEDELKAILDKLKPNKYKKEKVGLACDLCEKILDRRGLAKIITTYIDVIPDLAKHWPDGRVRYRLSSLGTDTGRFSSGGKFKFLDENEKPVVLNSINSQNIPSHSPEIRLLFMAPIYAKLIEADDNEPFIINEISEIETPVGWKYPDELCIGDKILVNGLPNIIKKINYDSIQKNYIIEA